MKKDTVLEQNPNPNDTKYNFMYENNKKYMNLNALSFGDRKITYEEMHDSIEKYSKMLYKKGIRAGDVIAICCLNTPESVYLLYALDRIGAITVGINPFDNKEKIKKDIELTKPKIIITTDYNYSSFKGLEKSLNFSTILYSPGESIDNLKIRLGYKLLQIKNGNFKLDPNSNLSHLLKNISDEDIVKYAPYIEQEFTDIMFTGGSTGVHKGVDLRGSGLNNVVVGMNSLFHPYPGMVHLGEIPIGPMSYGKMLLHYSLCNNMEFALTLKAMPEDFYDELVRTGAEAAAGGPPHWVSLIEKKEDGFGPSDRIKEGSLSNLKYATSGGEAMKSNTYDAIMSAFKKGGSQATLGDGLGSTETWGTIIVNNGAECTPRTLGHNISTIKVKIVDPETKKEVEKGQSGLLFVSGPSIMLGYHDNPEETKKVIFFDENGERWLNLGDYIVEQQNGEYSYVGRQKRNFVSDVENIYPEQLEKLLQTFPEIREAIVTPISDEFKQFIPRYHISLFDENVDTKLLEEKICSVVREKLGENWLPGYIEYYYEPLKRMMNTKLDFGYYQQKDKEDIENNNLLLLNTKNSLKLRRN